MTGRAGRRSTRAALTREQRADVIWRRLMLATAALAAIIMLGQLVLSWT